MEDRELIQLVLDFAQEMNDLESMYSLKDFLGEKYQQFRAQRDAIQARYLTPRKQQKSIGGLCVPPLFRNVTEKASFTVEPGKKRRVVEVLVEGFGYDFRFALVFRGGQWRIDSLKRRHHSGNCATEDDKWVYGSF